jgi:CHAT domain-containing protein
MKRTLSLVLTAMLLGAASNPATVGAQGNAAARLAQRLDAAKTKEERAELLRGEKEAVTPELLHTLVVAGVRRLSEGDIDGGARLSEIACEVADTLGGSDAEGQCFWFQATVLRSRKEYPEALEAYRRALQLSQEAGSRRSVAATLKSIGEVYQLTKNYAEAVKQFEASAAAMHELGDREEEIRLLNTVAFIHKQNSEYPAAIASLEAALKIALELGNKDAEMMVRNNLGGLYRLIDRYTEALAQHQACLKFRYESGDKRGIASSLNNIGHVYYSMEDYEKALANYRMSLDTSREAGYADGQARSLNNMGVVNQLIGKYDDALAQHVEGLKLAVAAGDRDEEIKARGNIGLIYRATGKYAEALGQFKENLQLTRASGDGDGELTARISIGSIYRLTAKFDEALKQYEAALELAREADDKESEAEALADIGGVYMATSKFDEALKQYEACLKIARETDNKVGVASALNNIGVVYVETGKYTEALARYEESLKLARETGRRSSEAATFSNIGEVYRLTGRYEQALEQYTASLKIKREINDKTGEAKTLGNVGTVYLQTGRYADALAQYEASLKIARETGDRADEAMALGNAGLVYHYTGKYDEALSQYEAALALMRGMGDQQGEARALGNIGVLYQASGRYDEALNRLTASLNILTEIGDRADEAAARGAIAEVYRTEGKYADALLHYDAGLKIAREIGDRAREAAILHNDGLARASLGRYDEALAQFDAGLKITREMSDRFSEALLLTHAADVYRTQKKWRQAADTYKTAISQIEFMRVQVREPFLQISFFAQHTPSYYGLVESLLELGAAPAEVFAVSEQAKARTVVGLMAGGRVNVLKFMTAAERQTEQELEADFAAASAQLSAAYIGPAPDRTRVEELKRKVDEARQNYDGFRVKLFVAHPELQTQRVGYEPVALNSLSESLFAEDPGLCLLSYLVGDDKSFLLVVTGGKGGDPVSLKVYTLKDENNRELTADILKERLKEFRLRLTSEASPYKQRARGLYDILLAPAEGELKGWGHVVIIPDGVLYTLPFQALIDGHGRHLIETHSVSYAPSVTALLLMMKLADRKRRSDADAPPLFAMGRGTFPDQPQYRSLRLPKAEEQVEAIAHLFGVAPRVGSEATKARAVSEMGAARFVHFATHGELNEVAPMESAIVLGKGASDDGMLYARELLDMDLRAEMVVLSACDTGLGQPVSGEGMMGLAWALFVAGTPTSVITQWQVRDDGMNRLMLEFYKQLRQSGVNAQPTISKAEALRRAQLSLMKDDAYKHPYHWAAVALVGDWR